MVSFRAIAVILGLTLSLGACDFNQQEQGRIGNNQNGGNSGSQGPGNPAPGGQTPIGDDPCYPAANLAADAIALEAKVAKPAGFGLASQAYEQINTAVLKETCAANSCHGPESDFRPWVDNEDNFKRVAAQVRFRILNKNRKHYFPPENISDANYRLMKSYVDGIPNSGLPAGCVVDYRP